MYIKKLLWLIYKYMPLLFNENPQMPKEYEGFINELTK